MLSAHHNEARNAHCPENAHDRGSVMKSFCVFTLNMDYCLIMGDRKIPKGKGILISLSLCFSISHILTLSIPAAPAVGGPARWNDSVLAPKLAALAR